MESLVIVLVLIAVYALAVIAYRRPLGYQRVVWPLMAMSVAASLAISVWNMSSDQTALALTPLIADDKLAEAATAVQRVKISSDIALIVVVALPIYFLILLGLPFLITQIKEGSSRRASPTVLRESALDQPSGRNPEAIEGDSANKRLRDFAPSREDRG